MRASLISVICGVLTYVAEAPATGSCRIERPDGSTCNNGYVLEESRDYCIQANERYKQQERDLVNQGLVAHAVYQSCRCVCTDEQSAAPAPPPTPDPDGCVPPPPIDYSLNQDVGNSINTAALQFEYLACKNRPKRPPPEPTPSPAPTQPEAVNLKDDCLRQKQSTTDGTVRVEYDPFWDEDSQCCGFHITATNPSRVPQVVRIWINKAANAQNYLRSPVHLGAKGSESLGSVRQSDPRSPWSVSPGWDASPERAKARPTTNAVVSPAAPASERPEAATSVVNPPASEPVPPQIPRKERKRGKHKHAVDPEFEKMKARHRAMDARLARAQRSGARLDGDAPSSSDEEAPRAASAVQGGEGGLEHGREAEDGWTPLIDAAAKGQMNRAQALIEQAVDVNAKTKTGFTALMAAAKNGHADMARFLMKHGADPAPEDAQGKDALVYALENGDAETIAAVRGARIDGDGAKTNQPTKTLFGD